MRYPTCIKVSFFLVIIAALAFSAGAALAHEPRDVSEYHVVVGFNVEPAYEGQKNGVFFSVTKTGPAEGEMSMDMDKDMEMSMDVEEHGAIFGSLALAPGETFSFEVTHELEHLTIPYHSHENHDIAGTITVSDAAELSGMVMIEIHDDAVHPVDITVKPGATLMWNNHASGPQTATSGLAPGAGHTHEAEETDIPVEGVQDTLQVEVTHVPSGSSRVLSLRPVFGEAGHYTADLIPTAPGVYELRFFGTIEGTEVNESFISVGGGGGFDDIASSVDLQFPEKLPEVREIEGAVRGAQSTAQQAQDAALRADDSASTASVLAIVGIVLGAVGIAAGAGGVVVGVRRR